MQAGDRVQRIESAQKGVNHPSRKGTILRVFNSGNVEVRWDATRCARSTTTRLTAGRLQIVTPKD